MHRSNSMARNNDHPPYRADDDYIDIEVNTFSPKSTNFELQMTSNNISTIFPAFNLFYKGKLLPLLLPPRLQIVQNILKSATAGDHQNSIVEEEEEDFIIMDFATSSTSSPSTHTTSTPPSCRLSFELSLARKPAVSIRRCALGELINPAGEYFGRSNGLSSLMNKQHPAAKSWSNKLRLIKKSLMSSEKLKASCRGYLMALFRKSVCKDVCSANTPHKNNNAGTDKQQVCNGNKSMKVEHRKTTPFGQMGLKWRQHPTLSKVIKKKISKQGIEDKVSIIKLHHHHQPIKCLGPSSSSSSSSFSASSSSSFSSSSFSSISYSSSDDFKDLNFHKRSYSFSSDIDAPIEAAIAHCKK